MLAVAGLSRLTLTAFSPKTPCARMTVRSMHHYYPLYSLATSQYEDLSPLMKTFSDSFGGRITINALATATPRMLRVGED